MCFRKFTMRIERVSLFWFDLMICFVSLFCFSYRDHPDSKVRYHYFQSWETPTECEYYKSHEDTKLIGGHRFITEKAIFDRWGKMYNVTFNYPEWSAKDLNLNEPIDTPFVTRKEDKGAFARLFERFVRWGFGSMLWAKLLVCLFQSGCLLLWPLSIFANSCINIYVYLFLECNSSIPKSFRYPFDVCFVHFFCFNNLFCTYYYCYKGYCINYIVFHDVSYVNLAVLRKQNRQSIDQVPSIHQVYYGIKHTVQQIMVCVIPSYTWSAGVTSTVLFQ